MGNRLAPLLAVVFMDHIERRALLCSPSAPIMYCRYIDDCFVVAKSEGELRDIFVNLNTWNDRIVFTREDPVNGWLPFLNVQLGVEGNTFVTRWYRKPTSKNILLNEKSAHPVSAKRSVVKQTFRTATLCSTRTEDKAASMELATRILADNQYSPPFHLPGMPKCRHNRDSSVNFIVPYINPQFSKQLIFSS